MCAWSTSRPTDHTSLCPFKGHASYWSVEGDGSGADGENVAWSYEKPFPEVARLKDHVAFYQNRVRVEIGMPARHLSTS